MDCSAQRVTEERERERQEDIHFLGGYYLSLLFSFFIKKKVKKDLWSAAAGGLEGGSVGALIKNLARKNKKARADCSPLCQ